MTANVDRTIGRVIASVVGTTSCFATFFVLLMLAVALTSPDPATGSRAAPGWPWNLLFGAVAISVGIVVGRTLSRRFSS